jgi:ADP-heptose:LPS heptosyltransferase
MIATYVKKAVCSKPGVLSRRLRHPNPFRAPYHATQLDLARQKGLGDVLLCTPALRELKRNNPTCTIRFFTDFVPLLRGLPYIDEVHPTADAPPQVRQLGYEGYTPPRGHLAKIIGDQLGVEVTDVKPDCIVDQDLVESYRALLQTFPKPHVVILRRASLWTPNKDWPDEYWNVVAEKVSRLGTAIEIGSATGQVPVAYGSYLDLRTQTTVRQLAAIIAAADLYIGPVSGPMHIAAATGTPAVVIYGGYENPIGYAGYERLAGSERLTQIGLYSALPCAPCWRTDECPYSRKCLTMIEPSEVLEAARKLLTL